MAVVALALVPAAIAWACNPQAYLQLNPTTVTPGGQLTISGAFFKGSTALTLSLEPGGQVATVTTAGNGSFSTSITAPAATGSYTLTAIGFEADGTVITGLPARASFSVAGAASQPTPSGSPAPAQQQQSAGSAPAAAQPQTTAPSRGQFAEPEVPTTREFSSNRGSRSDRPATRQRAGSDTGAVNTGAGVIDSPSGAVFAGSVAREDRATVAATTPAAKSGASREARGSSAKSTAAPQLSERSAAGDVWSGFDSKGAPSLMPSASDATPDGGAGSALAWGLGLLGLGVVSLVGGLAVAGVRRRAGAHG